MLYSTSNINKPTHQQAPEEPDIYQVVAGVDEDGDDDDRGAGQLGRVGGRMKLHPLHGECDVAGNDNRFLWAEKMTTRRSFR